MSDVTITPVRDPERGFHVWSIGQIYTGQDGSGVIVPNPNDLVFDIPAKLAYRVVQVDDNGLSKLTSWFPRSAGSGDDTDGFVGSGPGSNDDAFRVYIDYSVIPAAMRVDRRLRTYSAKTAYVKLFLGSSDINSDADVISMHYSNGLDTPDNRIPVVGVQTEQGASGGAKTPSLGYCNREIENGAEVTMVSYTDQDKPIRSHRLKVYRTELVNKTNSAARYIKSISLKTPYLSTLDENLIRVPVNVEMDVLQLVGVVEYSDGALLELPIGTGNMRISGAVGWISTVPGERVDLLLDYRLSDNERVVDGSLAEAGLITRRYQMVSVGGNDKGLSRIDSYGVKLYTFPQWNGSTNRYDLRVYMQSIARDRIWDVTALVEFASDSYFDGKALGVVQRFVLTLDLSRVSPQFNSYRHVQAMDVMLVKEGSVKRYPLWTTSYATRQIPRYGERHVMIGSRTGDSQWEATINSGSPTVSDWVYRMYYSAYPVTDIDSEPNPPVPNYVNFYKNNTLLGEVRLNDPDWTDPLSLTGEFKTGDLIRMEFIQRVDSSGVAPIDYSIGAVQLPEIGPIGNVVRIGFYYPNGDPRPPGSGTFFSTTHQRELWFFPGDVFPPFESDIEPIAVTHQERVLGYITTPLDGVDTSDTVVGIGALQFIDGTPS